MTTTSEGEVPRQENVVTASGSKPPPQEPDVWIDCPERCERCEVLDRLEEMLKHPKVHRMPNLLLYGESGNGRTALIEQFRRRHPPVEDPGGPDAHLPVHVTQMPRAPTEGRFYDQLLRSLYAPLRISSRLDEKQFQVLQIYRLAGIRMLFIDDMQHVVVRCPPLRRRQLLNAIKYLGNELQISIVAVGTRQVFDVFQDDSELASRFWPVHLPAYASERHHQLSGE